MQWCSCRESLNNRELLAEHVYNTGMLIIGLTGGIGSGKSTVSKHFTELGVAVIDADEIAHELVEPGRAAFKQIVNEFGSDVLTAKGELDRSRLRNIVFDNPRLRKALESILHPLIRAEMRRRTDKINAPYCVLCIPLLVETRQMDMVDRVLVIDSPKKLQYQRIKQRDSLPDREIDAILAAQATADERLAVADDVIVNDGNLDEICRQVDLLHKKYLKLAG